MSARRVRGWARGIGVGHCEPFRVRRARHDRSTSPRRRPRAVRALGPGLRARPHRARREARLSRDAGHGAHDREGRPDRAFRRGGVGSGEGDPRRDDGHRGRALPGRTASSRIGDIPRRCTSARLPATGPRRSTAAPGSSWSTASGAASRGSSASPGCSRAEVAARVRHARGRTRPRSATTTCGRCSRPTRAGPIACTSRRPGGTSTTRSTASPTRRCVSSSGSPRRAGGGRGSTRRSPGRT